ncbi:MAG: hypothetical protein M1840_005395 [Geoglossum simile]|nr:MAG: hypothetical protein M1840_005395 [Geoglossum simile]
MIERLRNYVRPRESLSPAVEYEPLEGGAIGPDGERIQAECGTRFSWLDYSIFVLLGVIMLWAWNMFMAAGPYFQGRFSASPWILTHFQSAILSVSTAGNFGTVLLLAQLQKGASYPRRIILSLIINVAAFTLMALSTSSALEARGYLGLVLTMAFLTSLATGLMQNGVFSYVGGFGRGEYTQGVMTGHAIAGVLPPVAQIVSVLSVPETHDESKASMRSREASRSAFWYFLTATGISTFTLLAFGVLMRRHNARGEAMKQLPGEELVGGKPVVPARTLFRKLKWLASAVFVCFAVTMMFPVYTQAIVSVRPPSTSPRFFHRSIFTPFSILLWNTGDLLGRLLTLLPRPSPSPKTLFVLSLARIAFVPLYFLCNIGGRGAVVDSDLFYLVVVQFSFGLSNGWVGSQSMVTANEWVEEEEREAAGAFMATCLVAGLSAGSLLSFLVSSS